MNFTKSADVVKRTTVESLASNSNTSYAILQKKKQPVGFALKSTPAPPSQSHSESIVHFKNKRKEMSSLHPPPPPSPSSASNSRMIVQNNSKANKYVQRLPPAPSPLSQSHQSHSTTSSLPPPPPSPIPSRTPTRTYSAMHGSTKEKQKEDKKYIDAVNEFSSTGNKRMTYEQIREKIQQQAQEYEDSMRIPKIEAGKEDTLKRLTDYYLRKNSTSTNNAQGTVAVEKELVRKELSAIPTSSTSAPTAPQAPIQSPMIVQGPTKEEVVEIVQKTIQESNRAFDAYQKSQTKLYQEIRNDVRKMQDTQKQNSTDKTELQKVFSRELKEVKEMIESKLKTVQESLLSRVETKIQSIRKSNVEELSKIKQWISTEQKNILEKCSKLIEMKTMEKWSTQEERIAGLEKEKENQSLENVNIEDIVRTQYEEIFCTVDETNGKTQLEIQIEDIVERVVKQYADNELNGESPRTEETSETVQYENVYSTKDNIDSRSLSIQTNIMNSRKSLNPQANHESDYHIGDFYGPGPSMDGIRGKSMFVNELRNYTDKKWLPFGKGISETVMNICVDTLNQKVFVTGSFTTVDTISVQNIAMYDIVTKEWSSLGGGGINGLGVCMCLDHEHQILYVGGIFTIVQDTTTPKQKGNVQNIAAYNLKENRWIPIPNGKLNGECGVLLYNPVDSKLYVGGTFTKIGEADIPYIGVYNTVDKTWSSLSDHELNGPCRAICLDEELQELFVGGVFHEVGDYIIYYVASINLRTGEWSELAGGLQGHCNSLCLHPNGKVLYVGGTFESVGYSDSPVQAHHVAAFDLETRIWSDMQGGVNGICYDLLYNRQDNSVYVGGSFEAVCEVKDISEESNGNCTVNRVAKFDTIQQKWIALTNHFDPRNNNENEKIGLDGNCKTIAMDDTSMYFGGGFKIAGSSQATGIVRYLNVRLKR